MAGATAAAAEGGLEEGDDGVRLKRKGGEAEEMSVVWWVIEWLPKSVRATNALWSSFSPLLQVAVRLVVVKFSIYFNIIKNLNNPLNYFILPLEICNLVYFIRLYNLYFFLAT